jgi:hypothetical protein
MTEKFFNQEFGRKVVVAVTAQTILLAVALTVGLTVSGKIDKLIQLSDSLNNTMMTFTETVETAMGIDPEDLLEKADALRNGAETVGEGLGEGGSEVVDRVGDAWNNFRRADTE